ncbi:MAG: hypothetical protein R3F49_08070 [Planctomycetota bacterium]
MRTTTLLATALSALALATSSAAQTVVLDFEGLPSGLAPMPAGYGGVADWGSWASSGLVDPNYPAASGTVKILSVGLQRSIVFGQDVVFDGANVVSALPFSWEMSYQGQVVATSAVLSPNTGGPAVWLGSGYTGLVDSLRYISAVNVHGVDDFTYTIPGGTLGSSYCGPAVPNSTGSAGVIEATGSETAADNDVTLTALDLPNQAFGFFLTSMTQGSVAQPGGSQGVLCLGGAIGRYVGAGQIQNTGATGSFSLALDLTQTPQPNGFVSITAGGTWNFQAWHRDTSGGNATSNFTDAVQIQFQ